MKKPRMRGALDGLLKSEKRTKARAFAFAFALIA